MRFMFLIVAFCFSFNVMASTGTIQELESALNSYQYSLSVEWDQKDQKFYDSKTQEFFSKIEKLIKDNKLTQEELVAFASERVKKPELVEALKLRTSLLDQNASAEELTKMILESSNEMYSKGASWNGDVIVPYIGVIILVAILAYAKWYDDHHQCVKSETVYVCETYNSCTGLTPSGIRSAGFFGFPNYDASCISFPMQYCGYQTMCTEVVKIK